MDHDPKPRRSSRAHVYIIDGTLSKLTDGSETNAGLLYKVLTDVGMQVHQSVGYDPGIQAEGFQKWIKIAAGLGINESIKAGYATLSSRYRPGDRIFLFGYSRGAYAVRSLAGMIGRIGLLKRSDATERRIERAFRHYESTRVTQAAHDFCKKHCHPTVPIDCLGVWDTVKALGLPYPILNRLAPMATDFHDHSLGTHVKNAYQALALDENRSSYQPLPWRVAADWRGNLEQAWFAGAHPDIGGQVSLRNGSRTFSNIPFVWMLGKAEGCGLRLPEGWHEEFPTNPIAPMHGPYAGGAQYFLFRKPRTVGVCSSEVIHPTVFERMNGTKYAPLANVSRVITKTKSETGRSAQALPQKPTVSDPAKASGETEQEAEP